MDDLSNKYENENESSGILLEPQEKLILEQIAAGGPPHSQRAQSLLAIDAGVTQKIAALQSGQTVGQVSYWLGKFRRDRIGIFPKELLLDFEPEPSPPLQLPGQLTPSESLEIDQDDEQGAIKESEVIVAAEAKPEKKEETKVKSKKDKASKKKKSKKGKKKGKKKQAKKSKKGKKKKGKKN
jgi:hypothetical protein